MGKRQKIVAEIEKRIASLERRPGLCLHSAHFAATVLWRHGYRAVIQAGSMQWPRVRREEDDGVNNTHFAYMWTPGAHAGLVSMAIGNLPEMHCWVGIVDRQEIVDFTTRYLKAQAKALAGMTWTAPDPPRYLWCPVKGLPDWVHYYPNRDASLYACSILKGLYNPVYLRR